MTAYEESMTELLARVEALEQKVRPGPGPDDTVRITRRQLCTLIKRVHRLECLSNAELSEEQFSELELMNADRDKPWPR